MPMLIEHRVVYDGIQALNYSGSKELLKSPLHYQAYLTKTREDTKALRMGSYVHRLVLEPTAEATTPRYVKAPECDRRTKDGKAIFEAFTASIIAGQTIMTEDEWNEGILIANSAKLALKAKNIVLGKTEVMFMTYLGEVQVKCAIDGLGEDDYLYDLKTTEDASPQGFLKSVRNYKYNLQAYFYRQAFEAAFKIRCKGFRFVVVEKAPPYATAIYELGPELMTNACFDFEAALKAYKTCTDLGEWPGYSEEIQTIDLAAKATTIPPIQFA